MKAADYGTATDSVAAFVATNSICQGQQVPILWPVIFETGHHIAFAHTSFKWTNLASHNAAVIVVIVGISRRPGRSRPLVSVADGGNLVVRDVANINAYLVAAPNIEVSATATPLGAVATMQFGNHPYYGMALIFPVAEALRLRDETPIVTRFLRPLYGSREFTT